MKKLVSVFVSMLLVVLMVSGCGTSPAPSPAAPAPAPESTAPGSTTPAAPAEPAKLEGEITFWHSFTQGPRMESLQKSASDFMAENPGVKITIETFSWDDFETKWTTGLASGSVPDMSTALPNQMVEMIDVDAILPLDGLIDKIGRDRFFEAPLVEATINGKTYAVPIYSHAQVMWYRKDLLAAAGLEVPTTWDELYEAAKKINSPDVYGCSVPMGLNDMMATRYLNFYVRSAGEVLIKDGKANLTSKAAIDGINYWVKMYNEVSPKDSINFKVLDQATLYYQGKNAFDFNSGFQIGGVETNSPDLLAQIDCAPLPTINKGDPPVNGETSNIPMVIWKNSKNPEICEAFMEYLYEPERYVTFLKSVPVGMLPALKEMTKNETYLADPMVKQFSNAMTVISEAVGRGTAIGMENGPTPEAGIITSQHIIEGMFQEIILKNTPVEQAAKAAEDKLNEMFLTVGS